MARQAWHPNIIYCVGNIVSRSCHAASTHIFLLVENNISVRSRTSPVSRKTGSCSFQDIFYGVGRWPGRHGISNIYPDYIIFRSSRQWRSTAPNQAGAISIATESNGRLASSGQLVFGPPCVDTIVGKAIRNEALDLFIFSK